jgi:hypothetical protein
MFLKKNNIILILIILIMCVSVVNADYKDFTFLEYYHGINESIVFQGDNIVLSSILWNSTSLDETEWTVIPNESVYCIINNSSVAVIGNESNITNSDGIASVNLVGLNLSVGNYTIKWYYDGNDSYFNATSGPGSLEIKLKYSSNLTLSLSSNNIILGESVTLIANLTNASGDPIPNANITFNINGKNCTNNSGIATYIFTPDSVGEYNITATFNGNESYNGSISMSKTLIVGDSTIPPSNGINNPNNDLLNGNHLLNTGFPLILLLIIIIVGGFYWKRK